MVKIHIIVEGGEPTNLSDHNSIANNTESLRQSFNSFFCRLLGRNDISISMGYGYRNAVKQFLIDSNCKFLFVDSDIQKDKLDSWFKNLEIENINKPIIIPQDRQCDVYFMIQEMEAWFLKQPECFEKWASLEGYTKRTSDAISSHSLIYNKNIEDISKPSEITKILLRASFERKCDEKKRILAKYHKLLTAPILLDCLDTKMLEQQDSELHRFKERIAEVFDSEKFLLKI